MIYIVGFYKLNKILFNKPIAKISSIFLFLIPFFYGHFAINFKDIILAFAHVWITYYIYKYIFFSYCGILDSFPIFCEILIYFVISSDFLNLTHF